MRYKIVNALVSALLVVSSFSLWGQPGWSEASFLQKLTAGQAPKDLLAKRAFALYDPTYSPKQLSRVQRALASTGVDAVGYFMFDEILANKDAARAATRYFKKRQISFLVLLSRQRQAFSIGFTRFNGKTDMVDEGQPVWQLSGHDLDSLLQGVYRAAITSQPKKNLLVNETPETALPLKIVKGKSNPFFAVDLKVDRLAVPFFGSASSDSILRRWFANNYPFKFGAVGGEEDVKALRGKGFLYVLNYVYAQEDVARALLGYPPSSEAEGRRVKRGGDTAKEHNRVYKFYAQHLVSGDIFLGTRWDADPDWQNALAAYMSSFKRELGL